MTVAFPWSGRDVNALVPMSGRAAIPNTPAGTGFNWPSLVGRVSGYIRPVRGWGLRGLGQTDIYGAPTTVMDGSLPTAPDITLTVPPSTLPGITYTAPAAPGGSGGMTPAPWYASILGNAITSGLKVGSQIASYQLNPLYQKGTYIQTPQGAIYASNIGTGIPTPTATGSSMLPILLIGGALMMFMAMRK